MALLDTFYFFLWVMTGYLFFSHERVLKRKLLLYVQRHKNKLISLRCWVFYRQFSHFQKYSLHIYFNGVVNKNTSCAFAFLSKFGTSCNFRIFWILFFFVNINFPVLIVTEMELLRKLKWNKNCSVICTFHEK